VIQPGSAQGSRHLKFPAVTVNTCLAESSQGVPIGEGTERRDFLASDFLDFTAIPRCEGRSWGRRRNQRKSEGGEEPEDR
jgi:hypothetical protein